MGSQMCNSDAMTVSDFSDGATNTRLAPGAAPGGGVRLYGLDHHHGRGMVLGQAQAAIWET